MICPRCGSEISDTETICPECLHEIDKNAEFNDFREDGYVQIQKKTKEGDTTEVINYRPKYFNITELNMFVIAVVYILFVAVFTVFSYRYVLKTAPEYVEPYQMKSTSVDEKYTDAIEPETEPPTANTVKKVSIKSLYGSWKQLGGDESQGHAVSYYSFAADGYAQENYGSIVSEGKYKDISEDGINTIYVNIDSGVNGAFEFDVFGNDKDGYTLELKGSNGTVYYFIKSDAVAWKLKPIADYKGDEDLVGYWLNEEGDKAYEINKDGSLIRTTGGTKTNSVYTINRYGVITIKYMKETIKTIDIEYKLSKDKKSVVINNTEYFKTKKK